MVDAAMPARSAFAAVRHGRAGNVAKNDTWDASSDARAIA